MSAFRLRSFQVLLAGAALVAMSPAVGQTYVSSTGVDGQSCDLSFPCRTLAFALLRTPPSGTVTVLDSSGYGSSSYGPVTISQSVSIVARPGIYAGISVFSGAGITVDGPGIVVELRGLSINGVGGANGISFVQGAELHVSNCSVSNMTADGINATAAGGWLFVSDTVVRDNALAGIRADGTVTAIVERSRLENHGEAGIAAQSGASLSVHDSTVSNSLFGVAATAAAGATTRVAVDGTLLAGNSGSGANASSTGAGSLATLDIIRTTSTRSSAGSGAAVSATAPANAVMTVASSVLTENAAYGVSAVNNAVALANGNTIARNTSGGLNGSGGAVLHTRGNNAGEQSLPTAGTTPIAGF